MTPIRKAYGYVTRIKEGKTQVLVFQHPITEAGIQIPKGTVKPKEDTYHAVIREIEEETGLRSFHVENLIAEDLWENDDGAIHNRFFYKISVSSVPDEWDYQPTGGGDEEGLTFHFFWISSENEVELIRGHGDYLNLIFD
ncbi:MULTISPECIES: NUDIX hydrolase [Bacillaceae]|uniref:NUDIX hydrolase n=1 Tax=Bacillaceae TaxID=186817 RepID=UPI000BFE7A8E|nr:MULTISPECIES: NUDIX domain-containing protein [Bacillaceae]KAF0817698.1 MutT/nudix family protein [Bacillus sp. ZZV12-4809]MCM3032563.1 NUDIX domain-containing protein [Niallia sp. MER 6]PGT79486.1 DNA mismatch repair protein MutT [Bacillus sp. AFS040349]